MDITEEKARQGGGVFFRRYSHLKDYIYRFYKLLCEIFMIPKID